MLHELRDPQPGSFLVAQQLATMMFVQALRLHLAEGMEDGVGWLFALADKQMAAAISAMHADPAHRWTLQELARARRHVALELRAESSRTTVGTRRWITLTAGACCWPAIGWRIPAIRFPSSLVHSATNPKARSVRRSSG